MNAARRLAVAVLCALVGGLAFGGAQALATGSEAPVVEEESFSNVGSASATVDAQIDAEGSLATYFYEYGTTTAYGTVTSTASISAAEGGVDTPAILSGLQPGTLYHFRVVTSNEFGSVTGADDTLTTLPTGLLGLPDGRVYEMVTPPNNQNSDIYEPYSGNEGSDQSTPLGIPSEFPFEASADGEAVAYVGSPTSGGNGSGGSGLGNEYLATRSPEGGWTQADVQPAGYGSAFYQAFSSDLSVGILESCDRELPPLAAGAPGEGYPVLYARRSDEGSYRALFTGTPPHRSPYEFESYEIPPGGYSAYCRPLVYAGSSSNSEHLLFMANDALPSAPEANQSTEVDENNLYDSVGSHLSLVDVLPDGASEPNATFGAPASTEPGYNPPDFSRAISTNGSRIFWTDLHPGANEDRVFVRENDTQPQSFLGGHGECAISTDACTVPVSEGPARFWTATSDGRYVFYTEGEALYRFDVESQTRERLAGSAVGVFGASEENGEYVYYVDAAYRLYLWHNGVDTFVAQLSSKEGEDVPPFGAVGAGLNAGDWQPDLGHRTAEVTPNGRHLVFMSKLDLTGYPNEGLSEVYLYDAETGALTCVSCSHSGEPPEVSRQVRAGGAAAFLQISWQDTYLPRWVSESGGRVFFDSEVPLVARDIDGTQDVYEWERDGVGSCGEPAGCQYLLSAGTSPAISSLADASASGNDVFIISRSQLVAQDGNENFNLYDARVGGVPLISPPVCTGSGCQGAPPAPPLFATPASVTFNGVGNFAAQVSPSVKSKPKRKIKPGSCKRGFVKQRGRCVKRASQDRKAGRPSGYSNKGGR